MNLGDGHSRRIRRTIAALAITVTAALLAGCTAGGDGAHVDAIGAQSSERMPAATATQLKAALDSAVKLSGGSGGVAGVWAPWAGTWTAATGTLSKATGASPVTTDASFRIGSITKPATCTVLLDLVAAHKVKLDDPVSKYLSRMVGIDGLTLGQLCDNTSGLADYWSTLMPQMVTNPTRTWDPLELVSTALGNPTVGKPGTTWSNSNAGFVLLGEALQSATGESWQKLYEKYVTDPLGITTTTTLPTGTRMPAHALEGYSPDRDIVTGALNCAASDDVTQLSPSALQAAGGLVSNLDDTASLVHAVAAGSLMPKGYAATQQQTRTMATTMPSWARYGLGVEKMGPLIGHASSVPGYTSAAYSDPASGLTVVIAVNDSAPSADFARLVALELASIASKAPAAKGQKVPALALPWSASQVQAVLPYETGCNVKAGAVPAALAPLAAIAPRY